MGRIGHRRLGKSISDSSTRYQRAGSGGNPAAAGLPPVRDIVRARLGGARVDLCTAEVALQIVRRRLCAGGGEPLFVGSANLDHIHHFGRRGRHAGLLADPGADWLVLLDGRPLVAAARRVTGRRWQQLAGSDLLPAMLAAAAGCGARVGFLGGTAEMQERLTRRLSTDYPGLSTVGMWAPPRAALVDPVAAAELAADIGRAGPGLLVVGLGKPLQEEFLSRYGARTGVRVALAFGAAADFLAGQHRRAPGLVQRAGLEWLFRLVCEPRRLARRYLREGPPALLDLRLKSCLDNGPATAGTAPEGGLTAPATYALGVSENRPTSGAGTVFYRRRLR